jgi:hypothetical protein
MLVFSKEWFNLHQTGLVRFANTVIGRAVFGLPEVPIIGISPAGFSFIQGLDLKRRKVICSCRAAGNGVYSDRLRKYGAPLWWLLHFTDWAYLDRQKLVCNFGFNSLTQYSAAGAAYCYDTIYRAVTENGSFAACRSGAWSAAIAGYDYSANSLNFSIATDAPYIYRGFMRAGMNFDTSSIGTSANVTAVSLYQTRYQFYNDAAFYSTANLHDYLIVPYSPASLSSPTGSDATSFTSPVLGSLAWGGVVAWRAGWGIASSPNTLFSISLSTPSVIKGGATSLMMMFRGDYANTAPDLDPGTNKYLLAQIYSADYPSYKPYLIVDYEYPVKINIGDAWKEATDLQINIGDVWKSISELKINVSDVWKVAF